MKTANFSCEALSGFTFKYPLLKGWEVKGIQAKDENRCIMYFNSPDDIDYEIPPQIIVEKSEYSKNTLNKKRSSTAGENSTGVPYEYITDSNLYVPGYKFKEGDWDWLVFYGKDYEIRIGRNNFGSLKIDGGKTTQGLNEFDSNAFYGSIIESFKFINS
jgi:hypothetical protein